MLKCSDKHFIVKFCIYLLLLFVSKMHHAPIWLQSVGFSENKANLQTANWQVKDKLWKRTCKGALKLFFW